MNPALETVSKSIPDIIREAATSPLGIFALMIVAICFIAYVLGRDLKPSLRFVLILILLGGVGAYGFALTKTSQVVIRTITGHILNKITDEPVSEANVTLAFSGVSRSMPSDSDGTYLFSDDKGFHALTRLTVVAQGFETYDHVLDDDPASFPAEIRLSPVANASPVKGAVPIKLPHSATIAAPPKLGETASGYSYVVVWSGPNRNQAVAAAGELRNKGFRDATVWATSSGVYQVSIGFLPTAEARAYGQKAVAEIGGQMKGFALLPGKTVTKKVW